MSTDRAPTDRVVQAVHGRGDTPADPSYVRDLVTELRRLYGAAALIELYGRFSSGDGFVDAMMRKVIWQCVARACGCGLQVGSGAGFKHPETFEIGNGVFIGAQAYIQGRYDGTCVIGDNVWIGPQAYFDARDLVIEDFVGWGPGAKVLGSYHTGVPVDVPIISTDLKIKPVRVGAWADIGTNATVLPGVTIGKGALVGAGAVVVSDVESFAVVAGVPAKFLRWRTESPARQNPEQ
ncbi:acyltransferase [Sinorhizobium numidicum]|uniref:Acyltransferase n=1 Tax=Sinorhizobium numidicum TaxID=680248 RepID=A0ABY8CS49_9HYPH|nr:acyltransferase [Sinorhizobium numidicum]WEX74998.1 acyltransferase [Sinorhizobium numidicum]WEX80992.1 acyltransferase [Sinorhizobium numidicum]